MSGTLEETPRWRIWCKHHNTDLVEIEHYENWFQVMDLSGFCCPKCSEEEETNPKGDGSGFHDDTWAITPIGKDSPNLIGLVNWD